MMNMSIAPKPHTARTTLEEAQQALQAAQAEAAQQRVAVDTFSAVQSAGATSGAVNELHGNLGAVASGGAQSLLALANARVADARQAVTRAQHVVTNLSAGPLKLALGDDVGEAAASRGIDLGVPTEALLRFLHADTQLAGAGTALVGALKAQTPVHTQTGLDKSSEVNNAKTRIVYGGASFVAATDMKTPTGQAIRDALERGVTVDFHLLNPNAPNLEQRAADFGQSAAALRAEINTTLAQIEDLRATLSPAARDKLQVHVVESTPSVGFFLHDDRLFVNRHSLGVDPGQNNGHQGGIYAINSTLVGDVLDGFKAAQLMPE